MADRGRGGRAAITGTPVDPALRRRALLTLHRYCQLVDGGTLPTEVFTSDCTVDYGTRRGAVHGREALEAFFARNHAVLRRTSHHVASVRVRWATEARDAVQVSAHVLAWHRLTGGQTFEVFGRYDDLMVEDGGELRIATRRYRTYGSDDPAFDFARVERRVCD